MRVWIGVLAWGLLSCGDGDEPLGLGADGALDTGQAADQGPVDAAPADGGPEDAAADQGRLDAGVADSAVLDASPADARAADADPADRGFDADLPDGEPADRGLDPDAAVDADAGVDPDADLPRERACFNGEDDDGDGRVDCADPDCRPAVACIGAREICDNGVDDNGDDIVDCDDLYCHEDPLCPPLDVAAYTDAELLAVFRVDCAGCHTDGGDDARLRLDRPLAEQLIDVPSAQLAMMRVASGKRADSYLYYKVRYRHQEAPGGGGGGEGMPPHAPWTAQKVERLGLWIDGLDD